MPLINKSSVLLYNNDYTMIPIYYPIFVSSDSYFMNFITFIIYLYWHFVAEAESCGPPAPN